jgi:hypothetical protein
MHLRSTIVGAPHFTLDPATCAYAGRIGQIAKVEGGTGKFCHASGTFKGTVRAYGVAARNGAGSCNQQADSLLEADVVVGRGTLSY